ncbi:PTS chitobiose transporter subunit IIA (plasmid) [Borrelia miyamotoi]|uniref:PTS lactose/cellobiose transporter subunit IIA n=1 Tax=Borrelia miyamotoi TaxID=47466 RepID=UPI000B8D76BE|nr:PTS lactose/cellobiose transporter subunit IIA [Borrelia miyamotoi]ASQ29687.1 PTS chitobiose transporter subunit IIA [Borrelia miyamotoi]
MRQRKYTVEELIDDVSMPVVAYAGEAKSFLREALEHAKVGDYDKADQIMNESRMSIERAHEAHRGVIQYSAMKPDSIKIPFILMHAEDHLMSVSSELNIFEELINIYKVIDKLNKN